MDSQNEYVVPKLKNSILSEQFQSPNEKSQKQSNKNIEIKFSVQDAFLE